MNNFFFIYPNALRVKENKNQKKFLGFYHHHYLPIKKTDQKQVHFEPLRSYCVR